MRIPVLASLPSQRGVQGWNFLMWSRWWLCSSPSRLDGEDKMWCWYPRTLQMHSLPSCGCGITVPQSLSLCIKQHFLALYALEKRENLVIKTHSESFALHQCRLCQAGALVQVKINTLKILFPKAAIKMYETISKIDPYFRFHFLSLPWWSPKWEETLGLTKQNPVSEVSHTAYVYFCPYLRKEWGPFFWKASSLLASDSANVITLIKTHGFL